MYTHTHRHTQTHTHTHAHTQRHRDTQTHKHADTHTNTDTETHIYTYTHAYTQTQIQTHLPGRCHLHIFVDVSWLFASSCPPADREYCGIRELLHTAIQTYQSRHMLTHAHQFYTLNRLDDFRRDDWNFISGWCTAIHSELFSPAHVWCVSVHVLEPSLPISGVEGAQFWDGRGRYTKKQCHIEEDHTGSVDLVLLRKVRSTHFTP